MGIYGWNWGPNSEGEDDRSRLLECYVDDLNVLVWFVGLVAFDITDVGTDLHAFHHTTEHCMFVIKPGLGGGRDDAMSAKPPRGGADGYTRNLLWAPQL